MKIKNRKGFSLIELIFVIVILGILSAVAIPKLEQAKDEAVAQQAKEAQVELEKAKQHAENIFDKVKEVVKAEFNPEINKKNLKGSFKAKYFQMERNYEVLTTRYYTKDTELKTANEEIAILNMKLDVYKEKEKEKDSFSSDLSSDFESDYN